MNNDAEVLDTLRKIYGLLELLAEDKIAERDAKQRAQLLEIAGASAPMQAAILQMDGTRTQKEISVAAGAQQSHISTLVGKLRSAKLLFEEEKNPKLTISIPSNFFEKK